MPHIMMAQQQPQKQLRWLTPIFGENELKLFSRHPYIRNIATQSILTIKEQD